MLESRKPYCLGVFAKYWQPGRVKTRLAKSIGEEQAADVYLSFVETILTRFGPAVDCESILVFSPDERIAEFETLTGNADGDWSLVPQGDGDLGERLHRFFANLLQQHERVVVIGTDSPTLPSSYLHQANHLLDSQDVVLGPSEDGGYYLVAAKKQVPPIFHQIDWSTPDVWRQTIARLQRHRTRFAVLPPWYDVDTIEDLTRLQGELSKHDASEDNNNGIKFRRLLHAVFAASNFEDGTGT